ncbi:MAG: caspase family protein [Bacteroidales bacterium]|nr:caspase family protein [Bacteroidales bacterium]MCF8389075.1 caspase family protein [Bacteroidales bacterium]
MRNYSLNPKFIVIILACTLMITDIYSQDFSARSKKYSFNIGSKNIVPPIIGIVEDSVMFIDENKNNILDPFENASILIKLKNTGSGNAENFSIHVKETNGLTGLNIQENHSVGIIAPNSEKTVIIPIRSNQKLIKSKAQCNISFSERNGFEPPPLIIEFNTSQFLEPKLMIADYKINSPEKVITKGTPFELKLLVQNIGAGKAENVSLNIDNPANTFLLKGMTNTSLKPLEPGDTTTITYSLIANSLYTSNTLPLQLKLKEKFNTYGEDKTLNLAFDQSLTATNLVIKAGENSNQNVQQDIKIAQLGIDVDKNIPKTNKIKSNRYALIIGNEDYTSYQPDLSSESNVEFARRDAQIFAEYCSNTLGIPENNITLLTDAISSQMKRELIRFTNKAQHSNGNIELVFYYSGHGFPDSQEESYIMPVDIAGANVTDGIKLSELYKQLTLYPSERVTIFIDACFSGGGRNQGLLVAKAVKIKPKEETPKGNLVIFTASSGSEESLFYKEKQHGLFTYFLLKKLQESKGEASYGELYEYLKHMVPFTASDLYYKSQVPQMLFSPEVSGEWSKWKF